METIDHKAPQNASAQEVKTPIIILALPKHDDAFTSTPFQLAREFAKERPVWYLSHPYTWIDFFKQINKKKAWKRWMATIKVNPVIDHDKLLNIKLLYLPLIFPINALPPGKIYDLFSWINHKIIASTISKMIKTEQLADFIFINSHDFYFGRIQGMIPPPSQYIYHCIDPIIKAYSARHGHYLEKEAATEADMVIATSPFLQKKMKNYNSKSYCVSNAANFALSHRATLAATTVHSEIQKIKGTKIGYIGNIERRIHYAWLTEIFSKHPDWQLVMVGPKDEHFMPDDFLKLPNLHLLSPVSHDQLPNVLKGFDVAFIPFKKDDVSAQIYPLKLFEYMGSGKPVVSTDFNEEVIHPFRQWIYVGSTVEEFERALDFALEENDTSIAQERIRLAAQNDWGARGKQFLGYINPVTNVR